MSWFSSICSSDVRIFSGDGKLSMSTSKPMSTTIATSSSVPWRWTCTTSPLSSYSSHVHPGNSGWWSIVLLTKRTSKETSFVTLQCLFALCNSWLCITSCHITIHYCCVLCTYFNSLFNDIKSSSLSWSILFLKCPIISFDGWILSIEQSILFQHWL